jgi:hypothetical protein
VQLPDPSVLSPVLENRGIDQVALVVPDVDAAVASWSQLLDLGPFTVVDLDSAATNWTYRGRQAVWSVRLALNMRLPQMELFELGEGPSLYHEVVEERGYGLHHVGIVVEDREKVDAVTEALSAQGIAVVADGGNDVDSMFAYYDTREALGCFLEMIWRPRNSPLYVER